MKQLDLNRGWQFRSGPTGKAWLGGRGHAGSGTVNLPHCWNSQDAFQEGVEYHRGSGTYRLAFAIPDDLKNPAKGIWILESEGFYGTGAVWLNRRKIADVDGEYLGFELDVTRAVREEKENTLAVQLTNRCASHVLPGIKMPDFLLYGGLSGRMRLRRVPLLRVKHDTVRIVTRDALGLSPSVTAQCSVHNDHDREMQFTARWTVADSAGTEIASGTTPETAAPPSSVRELPQVAIDVPAPQLWSVDEPALYSMRCEIRCHGNLHDTHERRFGFREAEFRPNNGFFLNGERLELFGWNRHESMPGFGRALPIAIHLEDAALLKQTGCNIVRLSHYPQHPTFLDACDELGILVYAEIASWKSVRGGRWLKSALHQLERLIRRDRNRPSVILWGMGNESRSRRAYTEMRRLAMSLDNRPTIYAENHIRRAERDRTLGIADVWGCNYELEELDAGRKGSRLRVTLVSESSNIPTARRGATRKELEQVGSMARDRAALAGKKFNAGCIMWCMNDYATLRKERYMRYSGVVDAWRVSKMSHWFLKASLLKEPFLKVHVNWREGLDTVSRDLHVFTNCADVTIIANGHKLAACKGKPHLTRRIRFQPGELAVRGTLNGAEVADTVLSHGPGVRLEILPEAATMPADAETVSIRLQVLDAHDRPALDWEGEVRLDAEGEAVLRAYTPDGTIPVANGTARTFISPTGNPGTAHVTARHPDLTTADATLTLA
jgi:beta-galactosidase